MDINAADIAAQVGGQVEGDPAIRVTKLARIEEAGPGSLSFLHAPKYFHHLYTTSAAVVLVPQAFVAEKAHTATLVRVENPYAAFNFYLLQVYHAQIHREGTEEPHFIHPEAVIGQNVSIGAFAYVDAGAHIGNNVKLYPNTFVGRGAVIGDDTILFPNTVVYHDCVVGQRCILHSGCVVGSDGFGFLQNDKHENIKVPQIGNVVLEDDVEIGSNSCIDRATLGSTFIRRGVKLDNLVQVAHNTDIGPNSVMAAQSGVSGSSKLGHNCMIGGQVGIVGHLSLAPFTQVGAQSGVSKNTTKPGTALRGSPAQPIKEQLRLEASLRQIGSLMDRVAELERRLAGFGQLEETAP